MIQQWKGFSYGQSQQSATKICIKRTLVKCFGNFITNQIEQIEIARHDSI